MNPAISGRYAAGITVAMVYAFRKGGMKVCADGGGEATLNRRISHPVWHEWLQNKPGSGGRGGRSVVPTLRLPWSVPLRPAMPCCLRTDSNRSTMSPFELLLAYGGCTLKPVFREASLWLIECPEVAGSGTPRHECRRQVYRGLLTVMDRSAPGRACQTLFRVAGDL